MSGPSYAEKSEALEQLIQQPEKVRSAVERYYEDGRVFVREILSGGYSLREEMARQRDGNRVFKSSLSEWHGGPQKWNRDLVNPASGLLQTLQSSFELLGPGGKSQNHGHQNTALLYVVEGHGYDISDGERVDWAEGDVAIVAAGTVHQHFNADPDNPAKVLIIKGKPLYMFAHLMFQGFVEKAPSEPVPGYEDFWPID
jgi:quercetin dioxygenase-like cupin family protein